VGQPTNGSRRVRLSAFANSGSLMRGSGRPTLFDYFSCSIVKKVNEVFG
jgi:hypothetical protein